MTTGFSKPNYSQGRRNRWHLGDKLKFTPTFRLLPPVNGDSAWRRFAALHWGYSTVRRGNNGKDYNSPRLLACVEIKDRQTREIIRPCDECNLISTVQAKLRSLEVARDSKAIPPAEFEKAAAREKAMLREHNLMKRYYMNALNLQGELGLLDIGTLANRALTEAIDKVLARGIDPLDPAQGVWFTFSWNTKVKPPTYSCEPVVENINHNGSILEKIKTAPLTPEQMQTLPNECWDLRSPEVQCPTTPEQMSAIVSSGGDPLVVERVLGTSQRSGTTTTAADETPSYPQDEGDVEAAAPIPEPQTIPVQELVKAPPPVEDRKRILELELELARIRGGSTPSPVQIQAPQTMAASPAPAVPAAGVASMSEKEFLSKFSPGGGR